MSLFGRALVDDNDPSERMRRFTLRGKAKVSTQWQYCLVHNIEKIATKAMRMV